MFRTLILALPFVFIAPAFAADDDIDCAKAMSQMAMNICANKDYETSDKGLNEVYRKLTALLGDADYRDKLRAAQRDWLKYRDNECRFEAAQNEGGSIFPMAYSSCMTRVTTARAKELGDFLKCWKDASGCGG